jgi:two-component system, NtrC family, response regulator
MQQNKARNLTPECLVAEILVIDDDLLMSEMLCDLIERMGHHAIAVHNLEEGLRAVEAGGFDIVFLDVHLPDGNGLDIMSAIKASASQPEIIIITAYGDPGGAELAIKNGAWSYIEKASSISTLTLPLVRALDYRDAKKRSRPLSFNREGIIGRSKKMEDCFDLAARASMSDLNVLITGETGTGKERFAWGIHSNSARKGKDMVTVDCASLPESLLGSVLFGHDKGAFTGAETSREGLIKQADGSTLFLDEIGELPLSVQKEFLRVLQERRFRPLGSRHEVCSDFRLISATNKNLEEMTQNGLFRSDLLYRIRSLSVELPTLRERPEDIVDLFFYFMNRFCERHTIDRKGFSPEFLDALSVYPWPGNIRELINTIEQTLVMAFDEPTLFIRHLPERVRIDLARRSLMKTNHKAIDHLETWKQRRESASAREEKRYLQELMELAEGDIKRSSEISGLSRARLYGLLSKYQITKKADLP